MRKRLSLYHKYTLIIICIGLLPMTILATLVIRGMLKEHHKVITKNYEQATEYMSVGLRDVLDSYDEISKMIYFYNSDSDLQSNYVYGNYSNLKNILAEKPDIRDEQMQRMLSLIQSMDGHIDAVHFVEYQANGEEHNYHYSGNSTYLKDEAAFEKAMILSQEQKTSKNMILLPTHYNAYYYGENKHVITIARNYFDLSNMKISNEPLLGTLYIDVNLECLEKIYKEYFTNQANKVYVFDENYICYYSNNQRVIGADIRDTLEGDKNDSSHILLQNTEPDHQLTSLVKLDSDQIFAGLSRLQKIIYIIMALSVITLTASSIFFSKRLSRPLREMMNKMSDIETGNFNVQLPVTSGDEVGLLSERFNKMSRELEKYVNQVYVAKVKQTEAELTSLRSQIYPHFLYNTLEIIRMTAADDGDEKVAEMIEALSAQIHYIIGNAKDMVPLRMETDIVEKYVYLLNCRINQKISLTIDISRLSNLMVPKLILQPIVENAYLHGIKPKKGNGNIRIEVEEEDGDINISVIDNGAGMEEAEVKRLEELLEGNETGIFNKDNRQSIGIKNVHDRIRYMYGERYGLSITSLATLGTIVNIRIPSGIEEVRDDDSNDNSR